MGVEIDEVVGGKAVKDPPTPCSIPPKDWEGEDELLSTRTVGVTRSGEGVSIGTVGDKYPDPVKTIEVLSVGEDEKVPILL